MTTPNDLREKLAREINPNAETIIEKLEAGAKADAALSVFRPHLEELDSLRARVAELEKTLSHASGYVLNAKIDLQTNVKRQGAIDRLDGALKIIRAALALKGDTHEGS